MRSRERSARRLYNPPRTIALPGERRLPLAFPATSDASAEPLKATATVYIAMKASPPRLPDDPGALPRVFTVPHWYRRPQGATSVVASHTALISSPFNASLRPQKRASIVNDASALPCRRSSSSAYRSRRPFSGSVRMRMASTIFDLPPLFSPTRTVRSFRNWTDRLTHDRNPFDLQPVQIHRRCLGLSSVDGPSRDSPTAEGAIMNKTARAEP